MPSRSTRSRSAPGKFDSPQTHQYTTLEQAETAFEVQAGEQSQAQHAQPEVTETHTSHSDRAGQEVAGYLPIEQDPESHKRVQPEVIQPPNRRLLRPARDIVVHIPVNQGSHDTLTPLMSPSPLNTPSQSRLTTPHLPQPSLKAPTYIAQAEEAPTWARTSPPQGPLLNPGISTPETPFRLPRSVLYHLDRLPGVFRGESWSDLNPLARPFVPSSRGLNVKSAEWIPSAKTYRYEDTGAQTSLSSKPPVNPLAEPFLPVSQWYSKSSEEVPPASDLQYNDFGYSSLQFEAPVIGTSLSMDPPQYTPVELYDLATSYAALHPVPIQYPHWNYPVWTEPELAPTDSRPPPILLAKFENWDMYPEHPFGGHEKLVRRNGRRDKYSRSHCYQTTIPDSVDSGLVISPLLCNLGGQEKPEEVIAPLRQLAKQYHIQLSNPDNPMLDARLQTVLQTMIKILLRHHDGRRPFEVRPADRDTVNPPDTLWLLVHTAHETLLNIVHRILFLLRRGCEGTQKGVALELLDRVVVGRIKGERFASHRWRKRQCERAREHDYQLGAEEKPTDLTRVTWREVVMLLRKDSGWILEHEPYAYDDYGTTY